MRRRCMLLILAVLSGIAGGQAIPPDTLKSLDVPGGLVVHIGASGVPQTTALVQGGPFLLHLLYTDGSAAQKARSAVVAQRLAGRVTVSVFDGIDLPFVDNVVNLLILEDGPNVSTQEMQRVLTPRGALLSLQNGQWHKAIKEVPGSIDDWTHNLYDASNVAVSKDMEAAAPRHLQWTAGPRYCRTHDATNSFQAMVACAGRVFYIMDEGSKAFLSLPPKWFLTARDGFNGKLLWKKKLPQPLVSHLNLLKSGIGNLAHRIVAQEDRVYVTLGFNAPVSALDSRTGEEVWVSRASANAEELIVHGDRLTCVVNLARESVSRHPYQSMRSWSQKLANTIPRKIVALDVTSGKAAWEHKPKTVLPLSLTVGDSGVFFHDGESIVCLDPATGAAAWRSDAVDYWRELKLYAGVNLVLYGDILLFSSGRDYKDYSARKKENVITALSAKTGKVLWSRKHEQFTNYFTATDLMVADGLVWTAPLYHPSSSGKYLGLDPKTGKVVREFEPDTAKHMPHHRCHRNRGTERYLFTGRTGVDLFDVRAGVWSHDYWARGTCRYGMMPANGMLYVPPNSCACYVGAKVTGFNAMTGAAPECRVPAEAPEEARWARGEAWEESRRVVSASRGDDWPTFRGSNSRHGMAPSRMGSAYGPAWTAKLTGKLTQPVIADGKVVVSSIDTHTIHALDQGTGKSAWSFLAGARVNSPPTLWSGRALFGCSDGWVYCLDLRNGKLVWKYRTAPVERRLIADDRLESVWPVDGSVLVLAERSGTAKVYCVAGRSMFLDGGMRMVVLDAATGRKVSETVMDHRDPKTGKSIQVGAEWPPDMPAALPDILSYAKGRIYMGMQPFSTNGTRQEIHYPKRLDYFDHRKSQPARKKKDTTHDHLYANTGFLDGNQWHRGIWYYGSDTLGACWGNNIPAFVSPSGNILCVDDANVYGYGREFFVEGKKSTTHLFGVDKHPDVASVKRLKGRKIEIRGPYVERNQATTPVWTWSRKIDVYVRAMLVARNADPGKPNLVLAAGAPDVIEEYDAMDLIAAEQRRTLKLDKIYEKEKAVAGNMGATLLVASAKDGAVLSRARLDYPPVFDGMSAADGRVYLSNMNSEVVCLRSAPLAGERPQ